MSYLGLGDDFPEAISIERIRVGVRFAGDNRVCAYPFTALWCAVSLGCSASQFRE